jgi:hypothetical protein
LYEEYLEGKEVEFKSHQGKGGDTYTYDPSVYTKVRVPVKLKFNQNSVFLDAVMNDDEETVKGLLDGEDPVSPDAVNHNGCSGLVLVSTLVERYGGEPLHLYAVCKQAMG